MCAIKLLSIVVTLVSVNSQCDYISGSSDYEPYANDGTTISKTDAVCCYGYKTCNAATISAPEIYCNGPSSCFDASISSTQNRIYCHGDKGCYKSTINTDDMIECHGYKACEKSVIQKAEIVQCTGSKGCYNSSITASVSYSWRYNQGYVDCQGYLSCSKSAIIASKVSCSGMYGCDDAVIYADVVDSVGNNGLINADIFPREWELEVDLEETNNGGRNANIYCSDDQICTIKCKGNGCESLNLYCEADATCIVEPSNCIDSTTNGQTFDGTICPSFV